MLRDLDEAAHLSGRPRNEILSLALEFALHHMVITPAEKPVVTVAAKDKTAMKTNRPKEAERLFTSDAIEKKIKEVKEQLSELVEKQRDAKRVTNREFMSDHHDMDNDYDDDGHYH